MNTLEVLFSCDDSDSPLSCHACDFRTETNLMNYGGGGKAQLHSLNLLHSEYVLAANKDKPLLHIWPINHHEQVSKVRFVLPGKANTIALSPDCVYLVAGIQETIYIWHLSSGRLLNSIAMHYQPIQCIRFTDDSSHFVTAARDGSVLVWNLTHCVQPYSEKSKSPLYVFNDHGLPVNDVHIGTGGIRSHMITVSLDRTCKIYALQKGEMLLNVVFNEGLQCVTSNAIETRVYVGTIEGSIYEFHTDSPPRTKEYHVEKEHNNEFIGHKKATAVNCLKLSLDGVTLISGGQDQQICIWHIPTRQLVKVLAQKGGVTNIKLLMATSKLFHPEHKQPQIFNGNLRNMIEPAETEEDQIITILPNQENYEYNLNDFRNSFDSFSCSLRRSAYKEHPITLREATKSATASSVPSSKRKAIEDGIHITTDAAREIEKLKAEVDELKRINKNLYQFAAKCINSDY